MANDTITTRSGSGFEQFKNAKECIEYVQSMAGQMPGHGKAWYNLTGTPAESLLGSRNVKYNDDVYDVIGFGGDRSTPWGPLPALIIAIRSDIARDIRGDETPRDFTTKVADEMASKSRLMGKDWKPAPGFEPI